MWPRLQRTIKKEVEISGIGVHRGEKSSVVIAPAYPNSGILFRNKHGSLSADPFSLGDSNSNTTLVGTGIKVETVEHLLSCLYGLFINNAEVHMRGDELPIGDGSAGLFYDAIKSAEVVDQKDSIRVGIVITKKLKIQESSSRFISIAPSDKLAIQCSLDWHKNIKGKYTYVHEDDNYSKIAYARTFAEKKYVNALKKKGLATRTKFGENTVDIDSGNVVDECLRHKALDILGDISLLFGFYLIGKIVAHNSGHKLHHELLKGLIDDKPSSSNRKRSRSR